MPKKCTAWYFAVPRPRGEMEWAGFVDMLRYDRALCHGERHGKIVLSTPMSPEVNRWSSMGLPVTPLYDAQSQTEALSDLVAIEKGS